MSDTPESEFERSAPAPSGSGLFGDLLHFLRTNKKWWLLPILAILLLVGALMLVSGTAAAPFIYTVF